MNIKRIAIKGFKSIKNQTVEMRNLNVLIGSNGIGKTNFVSVFELLKSLYKGELREFVIKNNGANKLLYMGAKNTEKMEVSVDFEDEMERRRYENELVFVQDSLAIKHSGISWFNESDALSISADSIKELLKD